MRILIIEDYTPSATVTSMYLEHCGFKCDILSNGRQALERIKAETYQAVLMDVRMRDFDGYQTTQAIRAYEKESGRHPIKIIAVTGLSHAKDKEKCLTSGMDDFLAKPFDLTVLKEKLTEKIHLSSEERAAQS